MVLIREFWFAIRRLARTPWFALLAIATITVALAACTAIYAVVYSVYLRPLPYAAPERLFHLWQIHDNRGRAQFSDLNFADLRTLTRSFSDMAEYNREVHSVTVGGMPRRVNTSWVSRDFFDVFGVSPVHGRTFVDEELLETGVRSALVSHRFWRDTLAEDRDLTAATLNLRGQTIQVVGVLPPQFDFPTTTDVWLPREARAHNPNRTAHNWWVVARLADDVTIEAARADSTMIARQLKDKYQGSTWMSDVAIVPLRDDVVGSARYVLILLLCAVALLLVAANANLANLLALRAAARRQELSVRASLGASAARLMVAVVAEAVLIAIAGATFGVLLAQPALSAISRLDTLSVPRLNEVQVGWPVLAFSITVALLTALAWSALIGWHARSPAIIDSLKRGSNSRTSGPSGAWRSTAVVMQLATSLVLLVGASLLGRSVWALLDQDPGFRTDHVLAVKLSTPAPEMRITARGVEFADPTSLPRQARLNERLIGRLRALPGVVEVGGTSYCPMEVGVSNGRFLVVEQNQQQNTLQELRALYADAARAGDAEFRAVSAGYFSVLEIPLIRGRYFQEQDTIGAPHVAVISESLARRRWPSEDPLGKHIQFGGMDGDLTVFTIVGIVGNTLERGLQGGPAPTFYAEYRQRPLLTFGFTVVVHTAVEPTTIATDVRNAVREVMPDVAPELLTLRDIIDASTAPRRYTFALLAAFAGSAVLLAVLGVFGVLSHAVSARAHEFGIRIALGAQPTQIYWMLFREGMRLVAIAIGIGTVVALATRRMLETMLFGVTATDPGTYAAATVGLVCVALFAVHIPASRATRSEPLRILRAD